VWSGPAWADNWQEVEHRCEEEIAERFNLPSGEYVMQCVWTYDGIESQHYYDAMIHSGDEVIRKHCGFNPALENS